MRKRMATNRFRCSSWRPLAAASAPRIGQRPFSTNSRRISQPRAGVRPYLFAISGVSGGSVGAAAFEAALTKRDESQGKASGILAMRPLATAIYQEDFLAPALASWIFEDTPSSFLPDFGQGDRGAALEKSFEHASGDMLARPFLSFFRLKQRRSSPMTGTPPGGDRSFCSTRRMRKPATGSSPATFESIATCFSTAWMRCTYWEATYGRARRRITARASLTCRRPAISETGTAP